ncbi:Crp/Fnr family transcriptional regulator [Alteriqipengyuania lutimaris]|uniref:Crp/Fnr family transcriptional regulator n=2 Tax=Alteriqipengyuania lutimaris TaxID=1538146 RepID=A0A395LL68_9SPHN|nr:Crp/Fnr family transcriptional regulator [Alteriqipengyuania lutimaris]
MREELARFPLTGRFLASRLRHAMTAMEKELLESLVDDVRETNGYTKILSRGDFCEYSTILIKGFMTRVIEDETDRSIVGFQVPGDFVDLHGFALKRLDHDLFALGYTQFGIVPHERLRAVLENEPHLARLFWFGTLLDASIHREWLSKMVRLRAVGRIAHVITELWYRLRMVGLGNLSGFTTPFTQVDLAHICGLSEIHVNRSVRDLRDGEVVDFRRGRITILNAERLKEMARFNPAYLYGEGGLEVGSALNKEAGERQMAK